MCVIIVQDENSIKFPENVLYKYWKKDNNGSGLMYSSLDKVIIKKGLVDFRTFFDCYRDRFKYSDPDQGKHMIIHFRKADSGLIDMGNCQPFRINNELGLCHHGDIKIKKTPNESDTRALDKELRYYPSNFIDNMDILKNLKKQIGDSTVLFLKGNDEVIVLNNLPPPEKTKYGLIYIKN